MPFVHGLLADDRINSWYVPSGDGTQSTAPWVLNVPAGQAIHEAIDMEPLVVPKVPSGQRLHFSASENVEY